MRRLLIALLALFVSVALAAPVSAAKEIDTCDYLKNTMCDGNICRAMPDICSID